MYGAGALLTTATLGTRRPPHGPVRTAGVQGPRPRRAARTVCHRPDAGATLSGSRALDRREGRRHVRGGWTPLNCHVPHTPSSRSNPADPTATGTDASALAPPAATADDLYRGDRGETYFARQDAVSARAAQMNLFVWRPFVRATDRVIEFGCGGGDLLLALPGEKKVGVEINPAAVARARARGLEVHESVAALPTGAFTRALSSHALEHVESPAAVLRELRRVLRRDGELLLLLPLDDWRHPGQRRFRGGDVDMHLHAWTPLTLGNVLVTAGFAPQRIQVVAHAWPPRMADQLWRASPTLFHAAARVTSVLLKKRQLFARATPV